MNKQIEEMRSDLIEIFDEEYEKRRLITPQNTAEKLSAKGYRKQSEGEWLHPLYDKPWQPGTFGRCSKCDTVEDGNIKKMPNYCSNCGAKMKPVYLQL